MVPFWYLNHSWRDISLKIVGVLLLPSSVVLSRPFLLLDLSPALLPTISNCLSFSLF